MGDNANQGKLAIMLVSYVIIFAIGAAGGYFLSGNAKTTTATNTNSGGFGQGQFGSGNFGGSGQRPAGFGGRAMGTVTAVNGNTITISTQRGGTETINLMDSTTYKETDASTKDKIVVGATISATADTTAASSDNSSITAATVTVQ